MECKRPHLLPLKKTAIPSAASDFSSIALLRFLPKVLEKIVHEQISEHLDSKKILDPRQTDFRQHNSTQTALLRPTEDIRYGIYNEQQYLIFLLLFDFSKAFDTVSPSKLLRQVILMVFSGSVVLWVKLYITGHKQRVVAKLNGKSDCFTPNLGVPQGSVLGSLLFRLYINDLKDILSNFNGPEEILSDSVTHFLCADELQIYTPATRDNPSEGIERLSAVKQAVSTWASDNALYPNTGKSQQLFLDLSIISIYYKY